MELEKVEVKLVITLDKVNVILAALAKLPYEASADVIAQIREQAQGQINDYIAANKDTAPVEEA